MSSVWFVVVASFYLLIDLSGLRHPHPMASAPTGRTRSWVVHFSLQKASLKGTWFHISLSAGVGVMRRISQVNRREGERQPKGTA